MKGSFVKINRDILKWKWYKNGNTSRLFMHLILRANFTRQDFENHQINRGQLVTSVQSLGEELGLSVQMIKTALKHLKSTGEITVEGTKKFSIITVNNYEEYQGGPTIKSTSNQPTSNQQPTNNQPQYKKEKNIEKEKKEREDALSFGKYNNVFLSDYEVNRLKAEYPDRYEKKIDRLSEYLMTSGKEYNSHYAVIVQWLDADENSEKETNPSQRSASYDIQELEKII